MGLKRIFVAASFVFCFVMGFGVNRFVHNYLGINVVTFIKSPLASWRFHKRDWDSFRELQYTQDTGSVHFHRNIETILLPLSVDGSRLSDAYPVPKMGGAITVVGSTVIILDRLGSLYRYDLKTSSFGLLPGIPRLPNNLEAYLVQRPGPPINLAEAPNDNDLRARDITFLPDRKELAVVYDKFDERVGKLRTVVSIIPFDVATLTAPGAWQDIFSGDPFLYGGITSGAGLLAYRGEGKLYLTIGDHYVVNPKVSEDDSTTFGKTIEINLQTHSWRQYTKGHRNQEGLTFLKSGQLLSTEHGPYGGDELNIITEGKDYGWPNVTLGTDYNRYDWPSGMSLTGSHAGYEAPLFAWVPSIAASQLIEVNNFDPRWDGDLLVGSLKASSLYRLRLESGRVLYSERIWIGERIRDLAQTDDGIIVLWTDDSELLFVTIDEDMLAVNRRTPNVLRSAILDDKCLGCHHFGSTNPTDFAPSLSNLLNRPIASDTFSYSAALRSKQSLGHWTPALLSEFLSDPFKFASGTNMLPLKISPEDIKDIVDILVRASDNSTGPVQSQGERRTDLK
ncbi:MAG: PQQ-dependent sugar dehydrogenase [Alphaproteobacteria bacterium]|nr:PQQ-dependent sugar dehydrogenase [Alphaproteobacteria bacterium]